MRRYQSDEDYWQIRAFLRAVFQRNGRRERSWHVARWDYWRWPGVESWGDGPLTEGVFIWEMPDGQIAAVLNHESHGHAFLQIDPDRRTQALEAEMLAVAESHLATAQPDGRRELCVWTDAYDTLRHELLRQRGYSRGDEAEVQHRWFPSRPIPTAPAPAGFVVRSLGDSAELPARAWASWRAFHPDAPAADYAGWAWYLDIQRCPLYRRDLDLVAAAPDGELVAFCTLWYDDVTRSAYFEPVATHPAYLRLGLGKAVMCEGLRRVHRLGATVVFVGGYAGAANALYASVMGPEHDRSEPWTLVR